MWLLTAAITAAAAAAAPQNKSQFLVDHLAQRLEGEAVPESDWYRTPFALSDAPITAATTHTQMPLFSSLFWKSQEPSDYLYEQPRHRDSLQQIVGFQFCAQLNLAVFDVDARFDALIADALLEEPDLTAPINSPARAAGAGGTARSGTSSGSSSSSSHGGSSDDNPRLRLFQLQKHRKLARVFSPTISPDSILPFLPRSEHRSTQSHDDTTTGNNADDDDSGIRRPSTTIRKIGHGNFIRLIDTIALAIYQSIVGNPLESGYFNRHQRTGPPRKASAYMRRLLDTASPFRKSPLDSTASARRFACFMAADGNNDWVHLTFRKRKLLRFVEGRVYFDNELGYDWLDMDMVKREAAQMAYQYDAFRNTGHPVHLNPIVRRRADPADTAGTQPSQQQPSQHPSHQQPLGVIEEDVLKTGSLTPEEHALKDYHAYLKRHPLTATSNTPLPDEPRQPVSKPHKLAYFILAHKSFDNVVNLLNGLLDPYVTILIHVDAKNPQLKNRLIQYLEDKVARNPASHYSRVRIMRRSFIGLWGHSSLVFAQLAGFFELLDMGADWEYVINLSGNDYPLRTNDAIYHDLKTNYPADGVEPDQQQPNGLFKSGLNFIGHAYYADAIGRFNGAPILSADEIYSGPEDDGELDSAGFNSARQNNKKKGGKSTASGSQGPADDEPPNGPHSTAASSPSMTQHVFTDRYARCLTPRRQEAITTILHTSGGGRIQFPFTHWRIFKHDQWITLHRNTVRHLKFSPTAMYVAAFAEFSLIPDEGYFATLLRNDPLLNITIVNESKRFLEFPFGGIHPRWITTDDLPRAVREVAQGTGWCRKVDIRREGAWKLVKGLEGVRSWDWERTFMRGKGDDDGHSTRRVQGRARGRSGGSEGKDGEDVMGGPGDFIVRGDEGTTTRRKKNGGAN